MSATPGIHNYTVAGLLEAYSSSYVTLVAVALGLITLAMFLYPAFFAPRKHNGIPHLGGFSILTAWPFFTRRFDFLRSNFTKISGDMFTFNVLHHSVTAMRGLEARKAFFDNKSLNFTEGYKILMGSAPQLQDVNIDFQAQGNVTWFNKQIATLLNRRRLQEVIPTLFDDIQARMDTWGKEGKMDPFKNIYDLVFQMTVRMATCHELASDYATLDKVQQLYWTLEKSATPTALLLPWFPSPAKRNKERATKELYTILLDYVDRRKKADVPSSDAIDVLLADGIGDQEIVGFMLGVVFAGVVNTGINSCWSLLFLSHNPEWREKVINEVRALIEKHTNTTASSAHEPLHRRLASIPIAAWEDEMPALDLVIRETLRIVLCSTALRRNLAEDMHVGGRAVVQPGGFLAYSLADVHMDPSIYTHPHRFDPHRFEPGREEDKNATYAFLGWGAGRHPCTGMKIAKLEIKIIVALFVAGYQYDVVDAAGNIAKTLPKPDYNDIQQARPVGEPCFIRYKRVVE